MENIESGDSQNNASVSTVEIPLGLLKAIRNLIEVTNLRILWKTEELYPVGAMIKQLDDLISKA